MVPPVRARAASDRGFDDSAETIPIARASSSPSIIQVPTQDLVVLVSRVLVDSTIPESEAALEGVVVTLGTELPSPFPVAADSLAGLPGLSAFLVGVSLSQHWALP